MARTARDVTDAELAILQQLWDHGPSSVRQLAERHESAASVATVQKLLERLEAKGWVERRRDSDVIRFMPTGQRDDLIGSRLQGIAEQLCEGSLTPLLTHLVRREHLTEADRRQLRELIESLDDTRTKVGGRK
jgi:BlaI family transcriptional regulator, penicillinase repressor